MQLVRTEFNEALSEALLYRAGTEAAHLAARAVFWRWAAVGLIGLGVGCGLGLGFYGYSYVTDRTSSLHSVSEALATALNDVHLKVDASGAVTLEPATISLAKNQIVSLDSGARIRVDPEAAVRAEGDIRVQIPTVSPPAEASSRASTSRTITNFTVFKSASYGKGSVLTGWDFLTSSQRAPRNQYCYYTENSQTPGLDVIVSLGSNGRFDPPKTVPAGFDSGVAYAQCIWFKDVPH